MVRPLMASSEPWITLGRDLPACRDALNRPGTELFVAGNPENRTPRRIPSACSYGLAGSPYIASIAVGGGDPRSRHRIAVAAPCREAFRRARHTFFCWCHRSTSKAQRLYLRQRFERVGELKDYCVPGQSELIFHKGLA